MNQQSADQRKGKGESSSRHLLHIVEGARGDEAVKSLPLVLVGLLVLASVWWDGAFDLRYWSPLTLLSLAILLALAVAGALSLPRRGPLAVSVVAIWALAGYALLSAAWAESAAAAWQGAAQTIFYAALFTLAVAVPVAARWRLAVGAGLVLGVVAIGLATEVRLLADGAGAFLAGRLNDPIGYRNGTAALFACAAWPLVGVAARRGLPSEARAGCLAAALLVLGLAFLTQSRGVLLGFLAGGAVSLSIGPDRLRRTWLALALLAAVALASGPLLTAYHASGDGIGVATAADVREAAVALLLLSACAFVAGFFAFVFDNGLRSAATARSLRGLAIAGLIAVAAFGAVVSVVRIGDPVDYADQKLDEFTDVESTASVSSTRLGSVGGQRYDLWRIAVDEFADRPLVGAGEGGYRFAYFRERRTDRNVAYAHSLPLRVLAETGLIGAVLFVAWLGPLALAIYRRARDAPPRARFWVAGLSAAGATVVVQSSVDWLWLIPGIFGLAVLLLGLAARDGVERVGEPARLAPDSLAARALVALPLFATLIAVGLLFLSGVYERKARQESLGSPRASLASARTAATLNPVSVSPLYLQASALETLGNRAAARHALRDAFDLEPNNFVTLGVLGDLEARAGNGRLARGYYRRALALNPRDIGLQELSRERFSQRR